MTEREALGWEFRVVPEFLVITDGALRSQDGEEWATHSALRAQHSAFRAMCGVLRLAGAARRTECVVE